MTALKNPAAVALGRRGGIASAKRLTKAQRHDRAKKARQSQLARLKARRRCVPFSTTFDPASGTAPEQR